MSVREPSDRSANSPAQGLGATAEDVADQEQVRDEIKQAVVSLMPWGVSIMAHAVLVMLAFFLVWSTIIAEPDAEDRPVPKLLGPPTVVQMDPSLDKSEEQPDAGSQMITPVVAVPTPPQPVQVGVGKPIVAIPVPGVGIRGIGDGPGEGAGIDGGPFLPPGGATKVVFLIDASGSMVDVLPFVMDELKQTVNKADSAIHATIVVFSGSGVSEVPGGGGVRGLRRLTPAFKQDIQDWATLKNHRFETGGSGSANVLQAIDRGLSYKPELVYLLSDNLTGGGQGATRHELFQSDIIDVIAKHRKTTPSARIHTIQFLYEDPLVRAGLPGTLRLIADQTGGEYAFFGQEDLGLR